LGGFVFAHFLLPSVLATCFPSLPAFLATLRRVRKAFFVEEFLLSGSPGEFLLTVNAGACLVFKFHLIYFLPPSFLEEVPLFFGFGPGF
jgi:hypothetical protein